MGEKIAPISGWLLLSRSEDDFEQKAGDWYIAWYDIFSTKKSAIEFAMKNHWPKPYRAARGQITVQP